METLRHPLARAALQEVVDLHAFFQAWLVGSVPGTDEAFAQLEVVLEQTFSMVTPDGRRLGRREVIENLRRAHGAKGPPGAFHIAIREPEVLLLAEPLVALGYIEEQDTAGALTRRRSTALLAVYPKAATWLAVHETWVEPAR